MGLDISDESIKYAELKQTSQGLVLGRYGSVAVPTGVIYSGKIQNSQKLIQILSDLRKKENLKNVRVSLPEEQIYLFEIKIPRVPYKEIRPTIELQIEEHIPIRVEEAYFDFVILDVTDTEYEIQVSAVPVALTDSYLEVFAGAGLEPLSFELEVQAIARTVIRKGDKDTLMIVDFGEKRTGISVVSNGVVLFTTTLGIGGHGLTQAVEKAFNIPFIEAEERKREIGLSRKPEHKELFSVLLYNISILRDEINKNFIYWHTHKDEKGNDHPKIQEVILCGGNANLLGLPEYLSASLRTKVVLADPWVNINTLGNYVPPLKAKDSLGYVTALGLALGDLEHD